MVYRIFIIAVLLVISSIVTRDGNIALTHAQTSSYKDMVLVTIAYYPSSGNGFTDARVSQATYCGEPLSPVGTRIQEPNRKQATIEMWYRMSPKLGDCEVKVLFTKDPGHRITSATIFNNVDEVNPFENTVSKTSQTAVDSRGKIEISAAGSIDTVFMCSYASYPNGGKNLITSTVSRNEFWKHDGKIDGAFRNINSALGVSFTRRSTGENITHSWNTTQTMPWAVLCANVRSKPFTNLASPTPMPPTPPPMPKPTVNLKINGSEGPITINPSISATLSWMSTNATSCVASNGWSGNKSTNGSETTGALITSKTYTITCSNASGYVSDSVVVNVTSASTSINHYVDIKIAKEGQNTFSDFGPYNATRGDKYIVRWTASRDITRCEALDSASSLSPVWSGEKPVKGSETYTSNLGYGKIGIVCYGKWGATEDSVYFGNYGNDVDIKASLINGNIDTTSYNDGPITVRVTSGSTLNLRWETYPNYTSCTASGSWTGTKTTKGNQKITLTTVGQRQYILTCKTASGSSRENHIAVNVEASNAITPQEVVKGTYGYQGNYYKNKNFETLKFQKVDSAISFDWGSTSSPNTKILGTDVFSIRWGAQLIPWKTGSYVFGVTSDEGVRVYLDGKLIIDNWAAHVSNYRSATVRLVAGRPNKLKIEYYEGGGPALIYWGMRYGNENFPAPVSAIAVDPL